MSDIEIASSSPSSEEEEEVSESVSVGDFEVDPEDAEKEDREAGESEPSDGEDLGSDSSSYARDAQRYQPRKSDRRQRAQADQDHTTVVAAKVHIYQLCNARQPNKPWNAKHGDAVDALVRLTADVDVTASPRPPKILKFDQEGSPIESDHALLQHMSPHIAVLAEKRDRTQPPTQGERDAINALIEIAKKI